MNKKIRSEFPIIEKNITGKRIIYFDNTSQTLKPLRVINSMNDYYLNYCGSVRSTHKLAIETSVEVDKAREKIAKFINAKNNEIIFTKNTTESINLIANNLKKGDIVLITDKEHNSNLVPWHVLRERGVIHKIVKSNEDGSFNFNSFNSLIKNAKLVSFAFTSIIDGYTIPAKEIIKIAKENNALVLLDGALTFGHRKIDVKNLEVDFLASSMHLSYAPTLGILYGKEELLEKLNPLSVGSGAIVKSSYTESEFLKAPNKFEAGLQNYPNIISSGVAIDFINSIGIENIEKKENELNKILTEELKEIKEITIIGNKEYKQRGNIFNFTVKNFDAHDVSMVMEEVANILLRSGMLCAHSYFIDKKINGVVSVSFAVYNTKEEVEFFCANLKKMIKEFS